MSPKRNKSKVGGLHGPDTTAKPKPSDNSKASTGSEDSASNNSVALLTTFLKGNKVTTPKPSQEEAVAAESQGLHKNNEVSDIQFIKMSSDEKLLLLFRTNMSISSQMDSFLAQLSEVKRVIDSVEGIQLEVSNLKVLNSSLQEKIGKLEDHNQKLERSVKRNNLILLGLNGEVDTESFTNLLPVDIGLKGTTFEAIKLGFMDSVKCPILLKFATRKQRDEVYKNRFLLKGTSYFLQPDYNDETVKKRYHLRQYLRKLKQGNDQCKPYMVHDKLFIDDIMVEFDIDSSSFIESRVDKNKTSSVR